MERGGGAGRKPLSGYRVAVTSSRRAKELAHLIAAKGGEPYIAPTVGIDTVNELRREAKGFIGAVVDGVDYAVFMTGPGVYSLFRAARELGLEEELVEALNRTTVVARSHKPKKALAEFKVKTDIVAEENTSEGIAKSLSSRDLKDRSIAVLWHGSYSPVLKERLEPLGAKVLEFSTYVYSTGLTEEGAAILKTMGYDYVEPDEGAVLELIRRLLEGYIQVVTFTSPPAVHGLFRVASKHSLREELRGALNEHIIVASIGPSTTDALEGHGVRPDVVPEVGKMGHLIDSLCRYVSSGNSKKVGGGGRATGG